MWFLLTLIHLVAIFHRVSFNVMADRLTAEFGLTGAALGNLAAAYTYMYLIMQIPGGTLVDRYGPRQIALFSGLSMAAGAIIFGLAPGTGSIFLGRMIIGFGGSVVLINIFKFQAAWFRSSEFATMSGFALLISGGGALLAATPLVMLIKTIGWRSSFVVIGLITAVITMVCWYVVRSDPHVDDQSADSTQRTGESSVDALRSMFRAASAVLSNRRIRMLLLINLGIYGGFIVFSGTWGVSYLVHVYGINTEQASVLMILAFLGYMIGAPLVGSISDRIGSRKSPAIVLVLCSALFWLVIITWPGSPIPLGFLYGLSVFLGLGAASTVMTFTMAREASPSGLTGSVTATVNVGTFLGLAILQPLVGYLLDLRWEGLILEGVRIYPYSAYRFAFSACLLFAVISLVAVLLYRENEQKS